MRRPLLLLAWCGCTARSGAGVDAGGQDRGRADGSRPDHAAAPDGVARDRATFDAPAVRRDAGSGPGADAAAPPAPWRWTNPLPSGNSLLAAAFADADLGLAAGDRTLLRTTDGGATWTPLSTSALVHVEALAFLDATRAVGVGSNPIADGGGPAAMTSDDAGATWTLRRVPAPFTEHLLDVDFAGDRGVAVGTTGTVLLSEDGGRAWTDLPFPSDDWLYGLDLVGDRIWVGGEVVRYSDDGGQTWQAPAQAPADVINGIRFRDASVGLAVGQGESVWRSRDGGATWTRVLGGGTRILRRAAFFADGTHAIAMGTFGAAWLSQDAGETWAAVVTPTPVSFYFAMPTVGATVWAAGTRGVIHRSDDFGQTWARQTSGFVAGWTRAAFSDGRHGCLVGELGGIVCTEDAGETWSLSLGQHEPYVQASARWGLLANSLRGVHFVTTDAGWAVGDAISDDARALVGDAVILRTGDGGATWTPQASGARSALRAVGFADPLRGWAVGDGGVILRTGDGGATWARQVAPTAANLTDVAVRSADEAWISGWQVLLRTGDGGVTWTALDKPLGILWSVRFSGADRGIAAGLTPVLTGGFEITEDGGASWSTRDLDREEFPFAAELAPDGREAVAAMVGGAILRSRDGGATWQEEPRLTHNSLFDARFVDGAFLVAGEFGAVLKGPVLGGR